MLRLLCLLLFVVRLSTPASAQAQTDPLLVLNTGGHQAQIRDVAATRDGRTLISAGNDKVIRLWETRTGRLLEEIRGQQSEGEEGRIYALALSPDNRYLAVGGWLKNGEEGLIRLYDFPQRKLLGLLKGHQNVIHALAFSADSRYLVSGSFDKMVRVWAMPLSGHGLPSAPQQVFAGHQDSVYGVAMHGNRVVSASDDKTVKLWELGQTQPLTTQTNGKRADAVAFSPDGETIVSGGDDNQLLVYDRQLQIKQRIDNQTSPSVIAFSPDGHHLVCGQYGGVQTCHLYERTASGWQLQTRYEGHDGIVIAAAFVDNQTILTGGGDNQELALWNLQGTTLRKLVGQGRPVWAVGYQAGQIAFTNTFTKNRGHSQLTMGFDLLSRQLQPLTNPARFAPPLTQREGYSLTHAAGGDYGYDDAVLELRKGEQVVSRITRGATDGYRHRCYSFGPGQMILSGGTNSKLYAYDYEGKTLSQFVGHTGEVWGIGVSADGRWLVSGGSDQLIKLWPLEQVGKQARIKPLLSLFVGQDQEWVLWHPSGYYDASPNGERYIGWHVNRGYDQKADYYPAANFRSRFFKPEFITRLLETGSVAQAQQQLPTRQVEAVSSLKPPTVSWLAPTTRFSSTDAVRYGVRAQLGSSSSLQLVKILLNGRTGYEQRGVVLKGGQGNLAESVSLVPGDNELQVLVRNEDGEVLSEKRTVNYNPPPEAKALGKPTLYVLAIGVSTYKNASLNLSYAHRDADALVAAFQKQRGGLYKEVVAKALTNDQANQVNIKKALSELTRNATQHDVVVLSLAGHGINTGTNRFYFLPCDADTAYLEATSIKDTDITDELGSLPCKVLALVDACHAGSLTRSGIKRRDGIGAVDEFVRQLISADVGAVVMSASTGKATSEESDQWQQGTFTKAVLEALAGKAEVVKDGVLSLVELDQYVTKRVQQLTKGRQHPVTYNDGRMPNSLPLYLIDP